MRNKSASIFINTIAGILCIGWLLPILWMMIAAFKPDSIDITKVSNWFVPPFTLDNIKNVLSHPQADVFRWMLNSFMVATCTTIGVLAICVFAAFAFSRIPFKGKNLIFLLVMIGMMIPREATLIPLYLLFQNMNMLNTYFSLIAPSLAAPFAIIILKNFFDSIPESLFEAAKIDGCSWFRMVWMIAVPLSKSAISSLAILIFLQSWNDFLWPFISISDPKHVTIPVGLPLFRSQYLTGQGLTMASGALLSFPVIIVFIFLQKYIVKSVASAGIKG